MADPPRPSIMADDEYQRLKVEATQIIQRIRQFPGWRFKHEARTRGQKLIGLQMWCIYLEAREDYP